MSRRLLVVHHSPTPAVRSLTDAVLAHFARLSASPSAGPVTAASSSTAPTASAGSSSPDPVAP